MEKTGKVTGELIDWGERLCGQDKVTIGSNLKDTLVKNAHDGLSKPLADCDRCSLISGECLYYHYGCDGQDDRGWGCGYRTVQTICSWLFSGSQSGTRPPPSLAEIQQALVTVGDKPSSLLGSREWIGTYEAALVLDQLYDVPCRISHVRSGGSELEQAAEELHHHFLTRGSPVMMGGDRDNSSKGILGVCTGKQGSYLLIMDPHYYGPALDKESLQRQGWVAWKRVSSLDQCSFYNLCLPQTKM
ncbi:inactive Ufm1-specific protease 1 [Colossoma macropomum]|uniref:inactive Ufm1-specific protease 1 n=1 Tax=Colossoma macropomum TaxID=42526 RepID=UPI00186545C8|nr:inactive Ufm1-specific protease 1 [Colossoma macropomum]XP_036453686.1 inactive Ufm1-specific protease 1 [Colossoma macropomum]XP_036453687.1 inactive Ufm1-specific protease 1 [Colossoma macropomum]